MSSKPSRAELFQNIVKAICGENKKLPKFTDIFYVIEPEHGLREILIDIGNNRVAFCQVNGVAGSILRYCNNVLKKDFTITFKQATEIASMWMYSVSPIPMPKIFAFKDDPDLVFHRAPFVSPGFCDQPPPLFSDLLDRCSDKRAFAAFIGSIFYNESDRQQYLYIHGKGKNGKSALIDILDSVLGPGLHTEVTPDEKIKPDTHWTSGFLGKRLIVFSECESPKFPTSGLFKALTGGDKTRINQKHKAIFSTKLNCKFIFLANNELMISSSVADQRRAIYCFIKENPVTIENYSHKMMAEAPQIIGYCMKIYRDVCPIHQTIEREAQNQLALLDINQALILNRYFDLPPKGTNDDNKKADEYLIPLQTIQAIFKEERITSPVEQGRFYDYLESSYGIKKVLRGQKNKRSWFLDGIRISNSVSAHLLNLNVRIIRNSDLKLVEETSV